jgi:hypothetical protein
MNKKPCCPASAMRDIRQLIVGGNLTGLVHLDDTLQEVYEMKIQDEKKLKKELLERVKIHNYVAPGAEEKYEQALFEEYQIFCKKKENQNE